MWMGGEGGIVGHREWGKGEVEVVEVEERERDDVPVNSARDDTTSVGLALRLHEIGYVGRNCIHVECDHGACAQNGDLLFDGEAFGEVVAGVEC